MLDVTAEEVEPRVDASYKEHPLLRRSRLDALGHLLTAADMLTGLENRELQKQDRTMQLTARLNALKHAIAWVHGDSGKTQTPFEASVNTLREAADLLDQSVGYLSIFAAYSLARRNLLDLRVEGCDLLTSLPDAAQARYDAYDLLLPPSIDISDEREPPDFSPLLAAIGRAASRSVRPRAVPTVRNVLRQATTISAYIHDPYYQLPMSSAFATFSLDDFRVVNNILRGVLIAWSEVCRALANADTATIENQPLFIEYAELRNAVHDVSGLSRHIVNRILHVLTYAATDTKHPDPVLQPIIKFSPSTVVLSRTLVMGGAPERNLIALVNTIDEERAAYDSLKDYKEVVMRMRFASRIPRYVRLWTGRLGGRRDLDVDCVLIDESARSLLFIEMKWFVMPAEPREVFEKDKELRKGVQQAKRILRDVRSDPPLVDTLLSDPRHVSAIVVSANSIGTGQAQDPDIPIINEEHLLRKLSTSNNLPEVVEWLMARRYLPVEDEHFRYHEYVATYFDWRLHWFGHEAIEKENFMPL